MMPQEKFLHVSPIREVSSAPHSRSCSFKARPRPKELDLNEARPRTNSMPNCPVYISLPDGDDLDDDSSQGSGAGSHLTRVRSFKTTSKGLVNHGDSFKKKSNNSLMSTGSTVTDNEQRQRTLSVAESEESGAVSGGSSCAPSYFIVVMLGAAGVGKTSLTRQFMTSEYMSPYDVPSPEGDEPDMTVSVLLDGDESMMEFIDQPVDLDCCQDMRVDAFVVTYSVADPASYNNAIDIVRHLRVDAGTDRAIILVANKIDLVRQRRITANEARVIAMKYDCKYTETSAALNHHVDELLVGILSQIRHKLSPPPREQLLQPVQVKPKSKTSSPKRAMSFLSKLFKQATRKSKSCDDLFMQ